MIFTIILVICGPFDISIGGNLKKPVCRRIEFFSMSVYIINHHIGKKKKIAYMLSFTKFNNLKNNQKYLKKIKKIICNLVYVNIKFQTGQKGAS